MQLGKWPSSISLLWVLALTGCAHATGARVDADAWRAERAREVEVLVAQPTPTNLAVAALLAGPGDPISRQPLELIARAEALAPQRADLAWAYLGICKRLKCEAKEQIESHLQAIDPDNGFVWTADLEHAESSGSTLAITAAIARTGAGPRMTFYWNELEVVPISKACRLEQLDLPGRRAACEALVARMEQSSTVLTQSLAISTQERWYPAGSPEREVVRAKRRRLDYLMTVSSRIRWWRMNRDMAIRIDAARKSDREEDVELAMIKSFGLPPEPPIDWKDTLHSS